MPVLLEEVDEEQVPSSLPVEVPHSVLPPPPITTVPTTPLVLTSHPVITPPTIAATPDMTPRSEPAPRTLLPPR